MEKPKIATAALAGCFGCHMSFLDIDERILQLVEIVDFDKSPINDIKKFTSRCLVGLVEGSCANEENVHTLRDFRENCDILISVGDCAIDGGIHAMRNNKVSLQECMNVAYKTGVTVHNPDNIFPNDKEIPMCLDKVYPCSHVVKMDYHLPGCPPSADTLWEALVALLNNKALDLPYELIKYD